MTNQTAQINEFKATAKLFASKGIKTTVRVVEQARGVATLSLYAGNEFLCGCVHKSRLNAPVLVEAHGPGFLAQEFFWCDRQAREYVKDMRGKGASRFRVIFTACEVDVFKKIFSF